MISSPASRFRMVSTTSAALEMLVAVDPDDHVAELEAGVGGRGCRATISVTNAPRDGRDAELVELVGR